VDRWFNDVTGVIKIESGLIGFGKYEKVFKDFYTGSLHFYLRTCRFIRGTFAAAGCG